MGAKGSSLGGENKIDAEALQMYFKQVGETRELQPGNVLITQGQPSESVFLLVEGETTLKKYNETGEGKDIGKIIGTRGSGQVRLGMGRRREGRCSPSPQCAKREKTSPPLRRFWENSPSFWARCLPYLSRCRERAPLLS